MTILCAIAAGDVVLLAGKGHEQSIFVGKERLSGTILPPCVRNLPRSATLA